MCCATTGIASRICVISFRTSCRMRVSCRTAVEYRIEYNPLAPKSSSFRSRSSATTASPKASSNSCGSWRCMASVKSRSARDCMATPLRPALATFFARNLTSGAIFRPDSLSFDRRIDTAQSALIASSTAMVGEVRAKRTMRTGRIDLIIGASLLSSATAQRASAVPVPCRSTQRPRRESMMEAKLRFSSGACSRNVAIA
mmetsp:Transcript_76951/g.135613  ORF Transcript_76951/g.135613 Transcript_76951/m.135613 type:complete len:200 (+) Transcript_76951:1269-1868(+)